MVAPRKKRVLVIDDEPAVTEFLAILLGEAGYEVTAAALGARGDELFGTWRPDAVITDLPLPDVDGLELVRRFRNADPAAEVIAMAAQGHVPLSVEAVKAGAFDFLEKPVDPERLLDKLEKALKPKSLIEENAHLKEKLQARNGLNRIIGKSRLMRDLSDVLESAAGTEANVLIQGEPGTGKELIASALHHRSRRFAGPFIRVNCTAIPKGLLESELFGYRKGAFAGAVTDKEGLLAAATGGSLLLDAIDQMPPLVQARLARVLDEGEYCPIGGDQVVRIDVRVICATSADPDVALGDGRLRDDFYRQISPIVLRVPPLRDRTEDLALLCDFFLDRFRQQYQKDVTGLAPTVYPLLIRNRWPGNVGELERAIERAVLVATGREIVPADLPDAVREEVPATDALTIPPHRTLAEIEKMAILQTLQRTNWNKQEAAHILGLYRPTLYSKMKKHDIQDPTKADAALLPALPPES